MINNDKIPNITSGATNEWIESNLCRLKMDNK